MEDLKKKIRERLQVLVTEKNKTIKKTFKFSLEKLQDSPRDCFDEIFRYLNEHEGKIEDFWFDSYIDEETFLPHLVMNVVPVESIRQHILNSHWEKLANVDIRPYTVQKKVEKILESFAGEANTPQVRESIKEIISQVLRTYIDVDFKVVLSEGTNSVLLGVEYYGEFLSFQDFLIKVTDNNLFR